MYAYTYSADTGGIVLLPSPAAVSKEPRPVYYREMDLLGFDKHFDYEKSDDAPYMWAEANRYIYRGKVIAQTNGGSCYRAPALVITEEGEALRELRAVDIEAMCRANAPILDALVQETVRNVYNTYTKYRKKIDVFYAAFSGGKDSIVTLDMAARALPHSAFKVMFGDTGMEFPDTYRTVEKVEEWCKAQGIEFLRATSHLKPEESWRMFGPPAQTIRWCCSVHKAAPQILKLRELTGKSDFTGMAFTGIRRYESTSRSEYDDVSFGEKIRGQYSKHVIIDWGSAEVYIHTYRAGLILNEAYKKGNGRAGCLVCPMATYKNMYFKEQAYSKSNSGMRTTTLFNDIILATTAKELSSKEAVDEFMNIGGWKARRSGKELSFAKDVCLTSFDDGVLTICLLEHTTDWKEWIKTVGGVIHIDDDSAIIQYDGTMYNIEHRADSGRDIFTVRVGTNTKSDIYFMSALKNVFRKVAYCVQCRVCEANCPNGFINMKNGIVKIDDKCIKCHKCHEVERGCLLANSLRLPKKENKMGSIDRYGNMGVKYDWVEKYFNSKDGFWTSANGLGTNMIKYLRAFLNDSEITDASKFSPFGEVIARIGIEHDEAWALMLCNLAYTSEFSWWVKNIKQGVSYDRDTLLAMLPEDMTNNSKTHIVSAYRNIFTSIKQFNNIGLGICTYGGEGNKFLSLTRTPWAAPDPRVVLYSLYKYSAACGGRVEFTLSRLMECDAESVSEDTGGGGNGGGGVSPALIFGLDRETMKGIITGLTANYGELISSSFTHNLDNVNLREGRAASDVLELF